MIQRIQTVYLFLTVVVILCMAFFSFVEMVDSDGQYYRFDLFGIHEGVGDTTRLVESVMPLRFLVFVIATISLITIFLYKKRIMQIRLCIFNIVLMLGFYALFFFYFHNATSGIKVDSHFKVTIVFPVIGAILSYLALRNIGKDEVLVRSYDRIR